MFCAIGLRLELSVLGVGLQEPRTVHMEAQCIYSTLVEPESVLNERVPRLASSCRCADSGEPCRPNVERVTFGPRSVLSCGTGSASTVPTVPPGNGLLADGRLTPWSTTSD